MRVGCWSWRDAVGEDRHAFDGAERRQRQHNVAISGVAHTKTARREQIPTATDEQQLVAVVVQRWLRCTGIGGNRW